MLTEQQVERSFRKLFQDPAFSFDEIQKADSLIEQLRWESPLRHRLGGELDELRKMAESRKLAEQSTA